MNKQIIIILVIIALMLLATMPTATSDANGGGKVWSDGYVGLTLNKIYRTDTVPPEFIRSPVERARPLEVGHDFVNINLTVTSIKGRHVLWFGGDNEAYSFLFDAKGDKYRVNFSSIEAVKLEYRGEGGEPFTWQQVNLTTPSEIKYAEVKEGTKALLLFEIPKDREPVRLRFIYPFTESWEKVSIKEGQIEIDLQVTPTPIPSLTPTLSPTPIVAPVSLTPTPITHSPTVAATEIPTPKEKEIPGFEVIFAIAGLLAVAYLLRRRE